MYIVNARSALESICRRYLYRPSGSLVISWTTSHHRGQRLQTWYRTFDRTWEEFVHTPPNVVGFLKHPAESRGSLDPAYNLEALLILFAQHIARPCTPYSFPQNYSLCYCSNYCFFVVRGWTSLAKRNKHFFKRCSFFSVFFFLSDVGVY